MGGMISLGLDGQESEQCMKDAKGVFDVKLPPSNGAFFSDL